MQLGLLGDGAVLHDGEWGPLGSREARERLLDIAQGVVDALHGDAHAARQAATAHAVCLRYGLAGLEAALAADYEDGGTRAPWRRFREAFRTRLRAIQEVAPGEEVDAVLFTLGCVRRLGVVAEAAQREDDHRARRPRRDRRRGQ